MRKYDVSKNYYDVLGVASDATREEVERAFRTKARKLHPDGGGSEEEMKSLNEARGVLTDSEARKAYDADRAPRSIPYGSSAAFDPEAASRAGTLNIPTGDAEFAGLFIGALACFGLGVPLLLLIEMQWVFFLWPLRLLALGALGVGVLMAHSALKVKHRRLKKLNPDQGRGVFVLHEAVFWAVAITLLGMLVVALYVA